MKVALRIVGCLVFLGALGVVAQTISPPQPADFTAALILPALAALALGARRAAFPLIAGCLYSIEAGAERFFHPSGDVTFVNQLSSFALFALIIACAWQVVVWLFAGMRAQKRAP
jgi:hypothetical protein